MKYLYLILTTMAMASAVLADDGFVTAYKKLANATDDEAVERFVSEQMQLDAADLSANIGKIRKLGGEAVYVAALNAFNESAKSDPEGILLLMRDTSLSETDASNLIWESALSLARQDVERLLEMINEDRKAGRERLVQDALAAVFALNPKRAIEWIKEEDHMTALAMNDYDVLRNVCIHSPESIIALSRDSIEVRRRSLYKAYAALAEEDIEIAKEALSVFDHQEDDGSSLRPWWRWLARLPKRIGKPPLSGAVRCQKTSWEAISDWLASQAKKRQCGPPKN